MNGYLLLKARKVCEEAHEAVGQKRKYTGEPYYYHPIRVARHVAQFGGSDEMIAAALLHDVVEDTKWTQEDVDREFGPVIGKLVDELTNKFKDPIIGNRAKRKALERARLEEVSAEAQTIKYADLLDNIDGVVSHDKAFAVEFLPECKALLIAMDKGNPALQLIAKETVEACLKSL